MVSALVLYMCEEELTKFLKLKFTESMMKSHIFTRITSKSWRHSSVVKSTVCTARRARSKPQHPHLSSETLIAVYMMPFSGLQEHQAHMWFTDK